MDFSLIELLTMFVLIGFAGFVDSIAGGGGLITIPTYLSIGVPPDLVLGTNKTVSTTGTSVAILRFVKNKAIYWKLMTGAILLSMLGSFLGAQLSVYLSRELMTGILVAVIPIILVLQKKISRVAAQGTQVDKDSKHIAIRAAIVGFVIGAYDGIFGPGTGTFLIIAFVLLLHMNYKEASANGRIINYISNLSAFFVFLTSGRIQWEVAGIAIFAAMIGNYLGSGLVLKKADRIVKPVFQIVLVGLLSKCIYDLF